MTTQPFDTDALIGGRGRVEIEHRGRLTVADASEPFVPRDTTSLLTAYLVAVRRVRRQRREPVIVLRSDDISVLAAFLGAPAADVIERLGALMGATRLQRTAMVALFASGALVVGLATTAAAVAREDDRGASGSVVPTLRPAPTTTTPSFREADLGSSPVVIFVDREQSPTETSPTTTSAPPPASWSTVASSSPRSGPGPTSTNPPSTVPIPNDFDAPPEPVPEDPAPAPTEPPATAPTPTESEAPPELAAPPLPSAPAPPPVSSPQPEPEPEVWDDEDVGDDPTVALDPPMVEEPSGPDPAPGTPEGSGGEPPDAPTEPFEVAQAPSSPDHGDG